MTYYREQACIIKYSFIKMELKPNQEFRFQVGEEPVKLVLTKGLAEIYGTEMLVNKSYTFPKYSKAAVFTFQGANLELTGTPMKSHLGQRCDYMAHYLNIHGMLEKMRTEAQLEGGKTPVCLVCKPSYARNVGKSTLCRILLNYAARRGHAPLFVDLDPDQGHIGIPGTIGALSIEAPIDIETGLSLRSSMLMHFGHTNMAPENEDKNGLVYKALLANIAKIVYSKLECDKKSYHSGVIINTSAWSDEVGYKNLVHACKVFKANVVLVMDDEILQDDLKKDLGTDVNVLNVPKTVGLLTRVAETNIELRYNRIKEYFYGTPQQTYSPVSCDLKFANLKRLIHKISNPLMLPASLMPIGKENQESNITVSLYDCKASDLLHHMLAISYCKVDEMEGPVSVLGNNIMGFICVTSVKGNEQDVVSVLSPQKLPHPLDYVLLYSDVQYMDSLI